MEYVDDEMLGPETDREDEEYEEDRLDPIVKRIPIFFNSSPDFNLPSFAHFQPILEEEPDSHSAGLTATAAGASSSKPKAKPLSLLQYPYKCHNPKTAHGLLPPSLRPDQVRSTNNPSVGQIYARYKPGVRNLKLEIPLENQAGMREDRFSEERAREFGRGTTQSDRSDTGDPKKQKSRNLGFDQDTADPLERITLGSCLVPEQTNYLLRPELEYLDQLVVLNAQAEKISRKEQGLLSESEDDDDSDRVESEEMIKKKALTKKKQEANEAKAIQVSVSGGTNADKFGRNSTGILGGIFAPIRAAEAETAVHLKHYHSQTKESEAIRQKMISTNRIKLSITSPWHELLKVS